MSKITTYADLVAQVEHLTTMVDLLAKLSHEQERTLKAHEETARLKAVSAAIQHDINRATMRTETHA